MKAIAEDIVDVLEQILMRLILWRHRAETRGRYVSTREAWATNGPWDWLEVPS